MNIVYIRQYRVLLLCLLLSPLFIIPTKVQAQEKKDSLFVAWENVSLSDSLRLQAIKTFITKDILYSDPERAYQLSKLQKKFAEEAGFKTSVANAINTQGVCLYLKGEIPTAITYFDKALKMNRRIGNVEGIAISLSRLGVMAHIQGNLKQALDYYSESLEYRKKMGNPKYIANVLGNMALVYKDLGDNKKQIETLEQALVLYKESSEQRSLAGLYGNIGEAYIDQGNYTKALHFLSQSLEIHESLGDKKGMAITYSNMSDLYNDQGNFQKAREYIKKSLKLSEEMGDQRGVALAHKALGLNALSLGKDEMALRQFNQSLKFGERTGDKDIIAPVLRFMGKVYLAKKKYEKALIYLNQSLGEAIAKHLKNETASTQVALAEVYFDLGQFSIALEHGEKAFDLSKEIVSVETTRNVSNILYKIYKAQHRYRRALEMIEAYYKTRDSLNNQENKQLLMQREFEYEYEKKEALANQERAAQAKIAQEQMQRKNLKTNAYIGGAALVLLFVVVLYANKLISKQRRKSKKIKELEKLKTQFYTNITHEFRTPLTLIVNPLEKLLHKKNYTDSEKKEIHGLQNQANYMMQLINQMLDLSKMDNGMLRLEKSWGAPTLLVQKIVDAFIPLFEEKKILLQLDLYRETDIAYFDPRLLETIVYNLISNAVKFTPKNGTIKVTLELKSALNSELVFIVSDTGCGISKQHQQKIFNRFYSDSQNKASIGTGIGLTLVKEFVQLGDGTIQVISELGVGSTFIITLPIAVRSKEAGSAEFVTPKKKPQKLMDDNSKNIASKNEELPLILIVDDHPEIRNFVLECLGENYRVIQAGDGVEGLESATNQIPDIVISDVMMPRMDGIEFIHKLKNNPATSHIPVILLTSKSERIDREIGLKSGALSYLTKPFYESELIALIKSILKLREKYWEEFRTQNQRTENTLEGTEDEVVAKLIQHIRTNIAKKEIDVDYLCREAGMSRTGLYRKLKAVTGNSTTAFVRKVRLDVASELLKKPDARISEVAYSCGFHTHSHFSKCFAEEFAMSPKDYIALLKQNA